MCYNTSCSAKEEMLFLREKIRLGEIFRQHSTALLPPQVPTWSLASAKEHFYQKNLWRLQPMLSNVGTTACDKTVASPPEERGPRKHIITNKYANNTLHVHRHYLCLASISLLMPLRLWGEGDLHWKCDGNQAVATLSVTEWQHIL